MISIHSKVEEAFGLINESNLETVKICNYLSEDVTKEFATENKIND